MTAGAFGAWRRLAREEVWMLRHTLLVIERLYERLLHFPPYRCSQCLNISNLTGDRTLGMRRLQKVANDIRQDTDTSVGQLTKDDDRGGVWRVAAFGA